MDAGLKIKIGADISEADVKLNKLGQTVTEAGNKLKQLPNASGQATFALTNLSRVAQDAPFGFIAIANNIDPLVSSFVSLRKEAGSGKGALQALTSSLAGGGGLILAFGLVSTALTLFGDKLFKLATSTGAAGEELKKINSNIDQLKNNIESIPDIEVKVKADTQGEIAKVKALAAAINDSTVPYEQQKKALSELQRINKERFGDLTLESAKYGELSKAVEEYTKQLVAEAFIKGSQEQITQQAKIIGELNKRLAIEKEIAKEAKRSLDIANEAAKLGTPGSGGSFTNESTKFAAAQKNVLTTSQLILDAYNEIGNLQNTINKNVVLKLQFDGTGEQDAIKKIEELKTKIQQREAKLKITTDPEGIKALQTEIKNFQEQILKLQGVDLTYLKKDFSDIEIIIREIKPARIISPGQLEELRRIQEILDTGKIQMPDIAAAVGLKIIPENYNQNILDDIQNKAKQTKEILEQTLDTEKAKTYADVLTNTLGTAFTNLFQDIISGGQNAFQAFGQAIAQIIEKLISAAITAAIFAAIISAVLPGSTFVGSFGNIFGQLSGIKIPGLASGGIIDRPTLAMVGEGGKREAVIPLDRLNTMIGNAINYGFNAAGISRIGDRSNDQLVAKVQGSDLAFVLARTNNTYSRLG